MFVSSLSFLLKPQGPKSELKLSQNGTPQLSIAHEKMSARPPVDWLGTFKPNSQSWTPGLQNL